jgi:hypothetical protein
MAKTAHNSRSRDEIARGLAFFAGLLRERRNVMAATDNLTSMHKHEEELRASSLAAIEADAALSDHRNLVAEAMNAIYAFTHDHPHGSENELTLQYLGIRFFNAAGASIKLALSGYYQKAFGQVRDVIETYFLVDYLSTYPKEIDEWKCADRKKRISHFVPPHPQCAR